VGGSRETSRWVEFVGGKWDGTMAEVFAEYGPDDQAGIVVYGPRIALPDGGFKRGDPTGHYRVDGWADEELGIILMRWDHRLPDDLK
jgi:hypothetical protein